MTGEQKPGGLEVVAKVVSAFGDPEAFGEREIEVVADLARIPYETRLTPAEPAEARIRELEAEIERLKLGCAKQNEEVCQSLGRALGYPAFVDDQVNFPGATEADGVCVGEHVAESISDEAARRIAAAEAKLARAVEGLEAIKALSSALRQGGPDPSDLEDLSDNLEAAEDVAAEVLSAIQQGNTDQ